MLEEVSVEELENETLVVTEIALVHHSDDVVFVERVLLHYVFQILALFVSEFVVHFCVTSYFDSVKRLFGVFVVTALDHLSERTFSENFHDLVAVNDVVADIDSHVAFVVVEGWVAFKLSVLLIFRNFCLFLIKNGSSLGIDLLKFFQRRS